ncbi:MAG: lipid-binding SYLF domain-containing protein [Pirellulaceae bacterium]
MRRKCVFTFVVGTVCLLRIATPGRAQLQPHGPKALEKATSVLNAFMNMPDQHVSRSILQRAQGLVIVPGMVNLEVAAHGRRGKGIAVARDEDGRWRPPSFVTMTGDTVDVQGRVEPTDIILVFNTRESVRKLYSGEFKVGVDAVGVAGPVGREPENRAEDQEQADIYSYYRGGGSFTGTTMDGSAITMDAGASRDYYQSAAKSPDGKPTVSNAQLPLPAAQFLAALGTYNHNQAETAASQPASAEISSGERDVASVNSTGASSNQAGSSTAAGVPRSNRSDRSRVFPPGSRTSNPSQSPEAESATNGESSRSNTTAGNSEASVTDASVSRQESAQEGASQGDSMETTRQQLAAAAKDLGGLLDESWRQYLALPQGVFTGEGVPTVDSLRRSLRRFETVANESKYSVLLQRHEFQKAYETLRRYHEQVEAETSPETESPSNTADSEDDEHAEIR